MQSLIFIILASTAVAQSTGPLGCCLDAKQYEYKIVQTSASNEINKNGHAKAHVQVDTSANLAYAHMTRLGSNGTQSDRIEVWWRRLFGLDIVLQHFRFVQGELSVCFFRNETNWGVFDSPCWMTPRCQVTGSTTIGKNFEVDLWTCKLEREVRTFALDPADCSPAWYEEIGYDGHGDYHQDSSELMNLDFVIQEPNKFIPPLDCRFMPDKSDVPRHVAAMLEETTGMVLGCMTEPW